MKTNTIIGQSKWRNDAWQKVTGEAKYVGDMNTHEHNTAILLRSPFHHARISHLNFSQALLIPGVLRIITAADIPGDKMYGEIVVDRPVLAEKKVRFMGEPVAIVVAENRQAAEMGRDAIQVEYEVLEAYHDPEHALKSTSLPIHETGNLLSQIEILEGNIDKGFKESTVIVEEIFDVPRIYPAYLEPEASLAEWNRDESITVWVSSQKPFQDRETIAKVIQMPVEKVIVKSAVIGGAFGGKEDSNLAVLASLASYTIKGNVLLVNTREESFLGHPKRHPARLYYRIGASSDGTIISLDAKIFMDTGAYASYGPAVGQLLTECSGGAYRIPNIRISTNVVYTNNPICGAMRGFGSPQVHFAIESLIDMLAQRLQMDPGEIRRKNIWRKGDQSFTHARINQAEVIEVILNKAIEERERMQKIPAGTGKISGVGIALSVQTMGLGFRVKDDSTNKIEWLPDGRLLLSLGSPDLGQGLATVSAQIIAESLGIPFENVIILPIDTSISPDGGVTCASRMTYSVGNSLLIASRKMIELLLQEASDLLHVEKKEIHYENGYLIHRKNDKRTCIPVREVLGRVAEEDRKLEVSGTFSFPYGPETPNHLPFGMPHVMFCFGAHVARVEIDPQMGTVEVKEVSAIHDVGKIINRQAVEGQIEGGIVTGIGYAISENLKLKDDQQWVNNFTEYLLPTTMDVPEISITLLEYPEETGPFGAKGIGEISLVPTAPAITNAIFDAMGVRVTAIPVIPEKIMQKITP